MQSSHRALLSQTAGGGAFGGGGRGGGGAESVEGPGRVRAAKDAYAETARKRVGAVREQAKRSARRQEEKRLTTIAKQGSEAGAYTRPLLTST